MKAATSEFLKQRFAGYYQEGHLTAPPSLEEREWGFFFFDPKTSDVRMRRHMAFGSRPELFGYIRNMVPAHIYYSTAYYSNPGAPTMGEKQWTGADLIFDLDADHIMRGPYDIMLERVKEETLKLISMLTDELGFDRKFMDVVFSGGRGYHIHVRDLAIRRWGSSERRELIDYVCGIGIDYRIMLDGSHSPRGWPHRYISALHQYLQWLESAGEEEACRQLSGLEGVGNTSAARFVSHLKEYMELLEHDPSAINPDDRVPGTVLAALMKEKDGEFARLLKERAALADEPVTTDIKRLIRLPSSLHGGSGLRVTPVGIRELPEFDPLLDAVVFGERDVKVDLSIDLTMPILGSTYRLEKGKVSVPEALAVFLCCRGLAELAGGN